MLRETIWIPGTRWKAIENEVEVTMRKEYALFDRANKDQYKGFIPNHNAMSGFFVVSFDCIYCLITRELDRLTH